jgi:septal ring factor EnvC (AmiA/AmiB activator)
MTKFVEEQDKIQQEVNRTSRDLKAVDDEEKKFKADLLILEQRISTNQTRLQELEETYGKKI